MKKIIYSLLICFLLLLTIPSVHAANETVYVDGKELIVTSTRAMQPANQQIPDSVGYFEEVNAMRYNFVVGENKYPVLKGNNYLPPELFNTTVNLYPTLFEKIYVYNGYWAYENDNSPTICAQQIYLLDTNNLFTLDFVEEELLDEFSFLNNTTGYFYKNENCFFYRFYFVEKDLNGRYIVLTNKSYVCKFYENNPYLPNDLKFVEYSSSIKEFNPSDIVFYSIINSKWVMNFDFYEFEYKFYAIKLFYTIMKHGSSGLDYYKRDLKIYFNIYENILCQNILDIDYMESISFHIVYSHPNFHNGKEFTFDFTIFSDDKEDFTWLWYYCLKHTNLIIDSSLSKDGELFYINNSYYRFSSSIYLEDYGDASLLGYNLTIDGFKEVHVTNIVYSYLGVKIIQQDPPQIIIKDNCKNFNFTNFIKSFIFYSLIIIILLISFKLFVYYKKIRNK
ncbi:MAG: hypothetical protein E7183_07790 [Erysipelotrichaceae bacterium]|nr:hypothetical protein [Erysipelotrichaceae bacterium]